MRQLPESNNVGVEAMNCTVKRMALVVALNYQEHFFFGILVVKAMHCYTLVVVAVQNDGGTPSTPILVHTNKDGKHPLDQRNLC